MYPKEGRKEGRLDIRKEEWKQEKITRNKEKLISACFTEASLMHITDSVLVCALVRQVPTHT